MGINVSLSNALAYGADEPVPAGAATPDVLVAVANQLKGRIGYVAGRLGWSESTLQKKISGQGGHVFSVRDLQLVQHVLGDIPVTKFLAAAEGYVCVKVNPVQVASLAEGLARIQMAAGELAVAAIDATGPDGRVSRNGLKSVRHFEAELLGAVNAVGAFIESKVALAPGGEH